MEKHFQSRLQEVTQRYQEIEFLLRDIEHLLYQASVHIVDQQAQINAEKTYIDFMQLKFTIFDQIKELTESFVELSTFKN
jgi:hypothetical protein